MRCRELSNFELELIIRDEDDRFFCVCTSKKDLEEWQVSQESSVSNLVKDRLYALENPRASFLGFSIDQNWIMGVLNVTPDSFSDGGAYESIDDAVAVGIEMSANGADIIDVGGESTRPGSEPISLETELSRVIPVVKGLVKSGIKVSVDTRRPQVMRQAAELGAILWNDVTALREFPDSLSVAAELSTPVILMHMQGNPKSMQVKPAYTAASFDIFDWLEERINICQNAGIKSERIIIDPGIGFGKTLEHNLDILSNLEIFHGLGYPIAIGLSRKSFIGELVDESKPEKRLAGSLAGMFHCLDKGIHIIRVHDTKDSHQLLTIYKAIKGYKKEYANDYRDGFQL